MEKMIHKFLTAMFICIAFAVIGCQQPKPADDKPSAENLIAIVNSDAAPHIRKEALHRLGHSGDKDAVGVVISATSDPDWSVRKQAIISLKYFSSKEAEKLLRKLTEDNNPKNQILAIESLYLSQKGDQLSTILQYLENDDPAIRSLAAQTFSYIRENRFLNALEKALAGVSNAEVKMQLEKAITFTKQSP